MDTVSMTALPFKLSPQGPAGATWTTDGAAALEMTSAPRADLFVNPIALPAELPDAQRLMGEVSGPFQLSAKVTAGFRATFDAGVLLVHADDTTWLKLCFEYSPANRGTVVSVVTRGTSDDANSWDVEGDSVYLRVSRTGNGFALHESKDGETWNMVRACSLGIPKERPVHVGFLSQSPTGEGCTTSFTDIRFSTTELKDTRDGS